VSRDGPSSPRRGKGPYLARRGSRGYGCPWIKNQTIPNREGMNLVPPMQQARGGASPHTSDWICLEYDRSWWRIRRSVDRPRSKHPFLKKKNKDELFQQGGGKEGKGRLAGRPRSSRSVQGGFLYPARKKGGGKGDLRNKGAFKKYTSGSREEGWMSACRVKQRIVEKDQYWTGELENTRQTQTASQRKVKKGINERVRPLTGEGEGREVKDWRLILHT